MTDTPKNKEPPAYRCDTCGTRIVAGACDCTKMQRPVLIGDGQPAPKDNMAPKTCLWPSCDCVVLPGEKCPCGTPAPQTKTVAGDLVKMLATMTGLVKLKYGNSDPGIWKLIQDAEQMIAAAGSD